MPVVKALLLFPMHSDAEMCPGDAAFDGLLFFFVIDL